MVGSRDVPLAEGEVGSVGVTESRRPVEGGFDVAGVEVAAEVVDPRLADLVGEAARHLVVRDEHGAVEGEGGQRRAVPSAFTALGSNASALWTISGVPPGPDGEADSFSGPWNATFSAGTARYRFVSAATVPNGGYFSVSFWMKTDNRGLPNSLPSTIR